MDDVVVGGVMVASALASMVKVPIDDAVALVRMMVAPFEMRWEPDPIHMLPVTK